MNGHVQRLRAEIASDRRALQGHLDELQRLALDQDAPAGDLARAAVALHHAYGAIESIMTRVARLLEGGAPSGPDWHQELLDSMALAIDGIRPQVLSSETVAALRQLLAFRHFFRHAYSAPLRADRLAVLRDIAEQVRAPIAVELDALDELLRRVADSD